MSDVPYGFDEDAETRRLLRSRPPAAALAWVESATGGRITGVRALRGGMSSAMHAVTVLTGDTPTRLVLRRYVRFDPTEPDIADREARALTFVRRLPLPTPELVDADLTGDVPMLLMTRLPGGIRWKPSDVDGWLRGMAALLPAVHDAALPADGVIRPFATYRQRSYELPAWAVRPSVWERAIELLHTQPEGRVFVHRDFHPGNVLWRRDKVSGLVDWQSASIGPASVDVGHCRLNLLPYGRDVVDRFTWWWERISGQRYDTWADLSTIIGCLDDLRDGSMKSGPVIEATLAAALAELG